MNPLDLLPSFSLALLLTAFALAGYLLGRCNAAIAQHHAGRVAGMKEERAQTNRIVIRAKMQSFRAGVVTERSRNSLTATVHAWASRN